MIYPIHPGHKEAPVSANPVLFFAPSDGPIVKYAVVDAQTFKTVDVVLREEG